MNRELRPPGTGPLGVFMKSLFIVLVLFAGCKPSDPDAEGVFDDSGAPSDTDTAEAQPDVSLHPEVLSFPSRVPDCESAPETLTIKNMGEAPLEIYDVHLGGSDADSYLLEVGTAVSSTLQAGESVDVEVSFKPTRRGDLVAELIVSTNDPDEADVFASLAGVAAHNIAEDIFDQPLPDALDVLWVIDNSCSMSEIVADLNSSLTSLTQSFTALGLDYHLAVVSTDMADPDHSGKLQGAGVMSPSMQGGAQGVVDAFTVASDVGVGGSADERGRDAAYAALRDPLLTGHNSGFLRADAHLAIVVVSDEPDSSIDISQSDFISWLDAFKGDPEKTSLSAMVNEDGDSFLSSSDPSCVPAPAASENQHYNIIAAQTGGLTAELCELDFAKVMTYLAYNAAGLNAEFPLSGTPVNAPLGVKVTVAGQAVPYSPISGWAYDAATNSIVFKQDSVPGPGEGVIVEYEVAGSCN